MAHLPDRRANPRRVARLACILKGPRVIELQIRELRHFLQLQLTNELPNLARKCPKRGQRELHLVVHELRCVPG
jgi:hypothetical protein